LDAQLTDLLSKIEKGRDRHGMDRLKRETVKKAQVAANHAARLGDYEETARYLGMVTEFGETWEITEAEKKLHLVRKLLASPDSPAARIEFAEGFWTAAPSSAKGYAEARQVLLDSLKLDPAPPERLKLYQLIQKHSFSLNDFPTAAGFADRICNEFGETGDACLQSLFELGRQYSSGRQPRNALETYERILALFPVGTTAAAALIGLGSAHADLGEDEKMVAAYKQAAAQPSDDPRRWTIHSGAQARAHEILGRHYMARGEWAEALKWLEAWRPTSWCGTCAAGTANRRTASIILCLQQLGRHEEAARRAWKTLTADSSVPAGEVAWQLFQMYRAAEQLDDLEKMLDAFQKAKLREWQDTDLLQRLQRVQLETLLPTRPLREMLRLNQLVMDGDLGALMQAAQKCNWGRTRVFEDHAHGGDWRCKAAAELLVTLGKPAIDQIRQALARRHGNVSWLIYALGRSPEPEALEILVELRKRPPAHDIENVYFALIMKGAEGLAVLQQVMDTATDRQIEFIQQRIDRARRGDIWPPATAPLVVRKGSLPRSLD
jgi:tetratricopeptide (TPR) repeat protein